MLQPYSRLFPDEQGETYQDYFEAYMATFTVKIIDGKKVYKSEEAAKVVWTFGQCVEKLRKARAAGDVYLQQASEKMGEFAEQHQKADKMLQLWADDCQKVWLKAHEFVLNEPAPEAPQEQEPADFGEPFCPECSGSTAHIPTCQLAPQETPAETQKPSFKFGRKEQ